MIHPTPFLSAFFTKTVGLAFFILGIICITANPASNMTLFDDVYGPKDRQPFSEVEQVQAAAPVHLKKSRDRDMSKGYWISHKTKMYYCIEFKEDLDSRSWNMSRCFEHALFTKKQPDVYQLTREAGTLTLNGKLETPESDGSYEFTEDAAFKNYLADNAIISQDENLLFHLFMGDMTKDYVAYLKKTYTQLDGDRLLELAIHGVTQRRFQEYVGLFEKYSNKMPSIQEVIEARIHGLTSEYIEDIRSGGFTNLSMKKMMEARIHGVNSAYIESLNKAGFTNLSIDKILEAKIHGIDPVSIKQIESLGYTNLGLDKIIEVKIHGVNSTYIQELKEAGFTNLTINKLIEAKIHGVNADFIAEAKNKGYTYESINNYIDLKIHGFDRKRNRD
ncbi:hypothetical protein GXP67_31880 [Rhodocytophaga rosea]|uniref:Uncharacterized protein n=1 Tax=Rhodocytophaga rosea TaxID=2704465 RepID=A0A6C0GU98_9BACT|nr:hypothetical protein [Rhodocytophaga rosea]QHT70922.1 hypothetical protein GXP67_31880 [Rhodocytophaga rosea]